MHVERTFAALREVKRAIYSAPKGSVPIEHWVQTGWYDEVTGLQRIDRLFVG